MPNYRHDSSARIIMKKRRKKDRRRPIEAAGGIVMRGRVRPLFAVVQLRRQKTWVLPKGKLSGDETALAAARREAIEETGHDVTVHEFLGALGYKSAGRTKIVRFWRMQASSRPVAKLMRDVRAVRWLSLAQATHVLSHERERMFLEKVGPQAVRRAVAAGRASPKTATARRKRPKPAGKRQDGGPAARARRRREKVPARKAAVASGVHAENIQPRPPETMRKLWTWLRR
jgi:8-oxo-dGTP diphosphatase